VNTLRMRMLGAFAYVLVLVLIALALPLALSVSRRVDAEVKGQAAADAHVIAAGVPGRLGDRRALQSLVARAGGDIRGRVIVVDSRGRLVADSSGTRLLGRSYGDRPEIAAVLRDGRVEQGRRRSDTLSSELLYTAVPVVADDRRVGAVRVTRSAGPIDARIRRDVLAVAGIALAALVLGLALAWLLASSLAKPLRGLARTAHAVGEGDLAARADVTGSAEQREVSSAFNEMADRLGRALEAQRQFVANASHQLRTPLTGLRLRLESAGLKARDPELERELAAAEHEAERLAKLLTALLTLAREGAAAVPRPVDLRAAAEHACERWHLEASARERSITVAGDAEVWAAAADEDVEIVLDNLLENALLYSPPGTDVTVHVSNRDGRAALVVLDSGPGIDGDPERLFERFARGKSTTSGTGLGLAIVRTLARRWGGEATLRNDERGGARAEVTLPVAIAPVAARDEVGVA
jgi:signal transduction histidine kinase